MDEYSKSLLQKEVNNKQIIEQEFPTGFWTLYYHPSREKRWTIDSFEKIGIAKNVKEVLSIFRELKDKIKNGMFFWMKGDIPPLWENSQNIRGGHYSIRGVGDNGIKLFKMYTIGVMLDMILNNKDDKIIIPIQPAEIAQLHIKEHNRKIRVDEPKNWS